MLKNQFERLEFLRNYRQWGVWLEVPELGMRCYRKDLPDESYIIVIEYRNDEWEISHNMGEWGFPHFVLVRKNNTFKHSVSLMSALIEHLKRI